MAEIGRIHPNDLAGALSLGPRALISLVGGGGKTTLLHHLARQLPGRVLATTTTKMSKGQHGDMTVVLDPSDDDLAVALSREQPVMAWRRITDNKAIGFRPERLSTWTTLADYVIVEADGARQRPFKAPGNLEPAVPEQTTHLLSVIGMDAIGRVIADQCHRPLRVAALARCQPGQRLTPSRAAQVLLHPNGMLRAKPQAAEFTIVVTKVHHNTADAAAELVSALKQRGPATAVVVVEHLEGNVD